MYVDRRGRDDAMRRVLSIRSVAIIVGQGEQRRSEGSMSGAERGFSRIEREHVDEACRRTLANGGGGRAAGSYFVAYQGQELPAKSVIREAYQLANRQEISTRKFSGGQFVARILERLGFQVVVRGVADARTE